MKLKIDVFSVPALQQVALELIKIDTQKSYIQEFKERTQRYLSNESAYCIEKELIAMGVYKDTTEAENGCFHLSDDQTTLEVHGDNHETVLKTITVAEFPTLKAFIDNHIKKIDVAWEELKTMRAEHKAAHEETWNKVFTYLVENNYYPTVEAAKEEDFTLRDGRFLEIKKKDSIGELLGKIFR
jgi:hypothetical protein